MTRGWRIGRRRVNRSVRSPMMMSFTFRTCPTFGHASPSGQSLTPAVNRAGLAPAVRVTSLSAKSKLSLSAKKRRFEQTLNFPKPLQTTLTISRRAGLEAFLARVGFQIQSERGGDNSILAMNKATTTNVTTPLYWAEDDALEKLSKKLGVPKAGALRIGLFELLKVHFPAEAKHLTRARIVSMGKQTALIAIGFFLIGATLNQSMRGNMEGARQARVGLRMVRTTRGFRWEGEMV